MKTFVRQEISATPTPLLKSQADTHLHYALFERERYLEARVPLHIPRETFRVRQPLPSNTYCIQMYRTTDVQVAKSEGLRHALRVSVVATTYTQDKLAAAAERDLMKESLIQTPVQRRREAVARARAHISTQCSC